MSTRSEWREGSLSAKEEFKEDNIISVTSKISRMSFGPVRHSVDRIMSQDRKVVGYKRTVSEPILWKWISKTHDYGDLLWGY